jgi:hypothetical protein
MLTALFLHNTNIQTLEVDDFKNFQSQIGMPIDQCANRIHLYCNVISRLTKKRGVGGE